MDPSQRSLYTLLEASEDNLYVAKDAAASSTKAQQRTSGWRRYIAPVVLLGTMIPTTFLLLHVFQARTTRNHIQPNNNSNNNSSSSKPNFINYQIYDSINDVYEYDHQLQKQQQTAGRHNVHLVPTLSVGLDSMCIGVITVSLIGLLGVAKGNRRLMNLYFGFVMVFISIQALFAVKGFLSGADWVRDALDRSWTNAYETDKDLIRDLQSEFNCKGFFDGEDRSLETNMGYEGHLPNCSDILEMTFGSRLERLGTTILWIRLIQLAGVMLLSILFRYLTILDQSDADKDEEALEAQQQSKMLDGSSQSGYYFLTEKQMADCDAHVPLLLRQEGDEDDIDCDDASSVVLSDDGSQITIVVA
ncbi:hypothetical protein KI688_010884 [Linnemannia hyalina]|uniref:Uncharacterized protein n=1 Tax=Linnemannia hyalina TaxID=64524 RepID=A0A9P7XYM9_9FUNG|nr:hypothetical protein KI688_010884 [Linnemannia hyalina]